MRRALEKCGNKNPFPPFDYILKYNLYVDSTKSVQMMIKRFVEKPRS